MLNHRLSYERQGGRVCMFSRAYSVVQREIMCDEQKPAATILTMVYHTTRDRPSEKHAV